MKEKRPKDMTDTELAALPTGPVIQKFIPYTAADLERGAIGKGWMVAEMPKLSIPHYDKDDILMWTDSLGRCWSFGQWSDGRWFKQLMSF